MNRGKKNTQRLPYKSKYLQKKKLVKKYSNIINACLLIFDTLLLFIMFPLESGRLCLDIPKREENKKYQIHKTINFNVLFLKNKV